MFTLLKSPSMPPKSQTFSLQKLQSKHVAFLPILFLVFSTGIRGVFLAGARSASEKGTMESYSIPPVTAALESAAPSHLSDSKLSPRPAHVLRLLTQTLQRQCVNQPGHTVTLCQSEIDNLLRLSKEAEAQNAGVVKPRQHRKPKPQLSTASIHVTKKMTAVPAPSAEVPMPVPMPVPMSER